MISKAKQQISYTQETIKSVYLEREVIVDFYMPINLQEPQKLPLLFINDGQDLPKFAFENMLNEMIEKEEIEPICIVAIHCGTDRMNEYGTAIITDYKGRGSKAINYHYFFFQEMLPYTRQKFGLYDVREKAFCGFSLGALSALDIVWNHANQFDKVGCFSGSFWWRTSAVTDSYEDDKDRIMHQQIRAGEYKKWLKFYFECGTEDEAEDRNVNGVIDSIDDTKELIDELVIKGYKRNTDIFYHEVKGGKHDVPTWGIAMPTFLKWGWGLYKDEAE